MKKLLVLFITCISLSLSAQPGAFSLTSPANGRWASATPTFQWGAASGSSFYRLYIDNTLVKDNLTSTTYQLLSSEALAETQHTWFIVAVTGSDTTKSTQTWSVRIDATPPAAFDLIAPANNSWTAMVQPKLQWSASSDAGSGIAKYQLWIDGILNLDNISPIKTDTMPINKSLTNGSHTWQIKAIDSVGNIGSSTQIWTFKIDNLPPKFSKTNIVNPIFTINWGWWSVDGGNWSVFDSLNNLVFNGNFDCTSYTGCTDIITFISPTTGKYIFHEHPLTSFGNNISGSYQISNALVGNGTFPTVSSWTNTADFSSIFTVGLNESGIFIPSGNAFIASNKPTFIWNKATDTGVSFQKYQLYIDTILIQDNLTDTFFTLTNPLSYGQHKWIVRACDFLGNFAPMFPLQFYIDNQPPNAFNLLTPLDSAVVNIPTPDLSWIATIDSIGGSGLSKYQLWINDIKNIDSIPISTTTTAPSAELTEGSYSWYVKAFDKVGNVRTSTQTRTFFFDSASPGAFTIISPAKGDTVKASKPKFVWHKSIDAGSGIKRYVLNISGQTPDTIATADTSAQFPTALTNEAYTWFVVAYDRGNNSKGSDTGNFVINVLPPTVPVLASPSNKSSNLPTLLRLKWFSSTGADSYKIQVSSDSTFTLAFAENKSGLTDTTDSISTALPPNTLYYWRVNATNSAATCDWSEIWNFMTIVPVPSKVSIIAPANSLTIVIDSLNIIWSQATPSIDKYCLEIASDSLFATTISNDSSITDTSKTCSGLTNKTTYWFHVKAHNSSGWGSFSDTRKITVNILTAVISPKTCSFNLSGMSASNSFIRYSLPKACNVSFNLFNVQGKLIRAIINNNQAAGNYQIPLNLACLSQGCYLVDFKAGNYAVKRKLNKF